MKNSRPNFLMMKKTRPNFLMMKSIQGLLLLNEIRLRPGSKHLTQTSNRTILFLMLRYPKTKECWTYCASRFHCLCLCVLVQTALESHRTKLANLHELFNTAKTQIKALNNQIEKLNKRLKEQETTIQGLQQQAKTKIRHFRSVIVSLCSSFSA